MRARLSPFAYVATTAALALQVPLAPAQGPGAAPLPKAEDVLKLVRLSQPQEEMHLVGDTRDRKIAIKKIPLKLSLSKDGYRFQFFEGDSRRNKPNQIITLELLPNQCKLTEIVPGKAGELPPERFAERVRGTDITYEDLAMRFLYWPNPKHLKPERAKGGEAWRIRCTNPLKDGPYATVDAWVSQESGALVKMEGLDAQGRLIKSFEVESAQRHKGAWVLQEMVVRTHPADRKGSPTRTFLKIEPPE